MIEAVLILALVAVIACLCLVANMAGRMAAEREKERLAATEMFKEYAAAMVARGAHDVAAMKAAEAEPVFADARRDDEAEAELERDLRLSTFDQQMFDAIEGRGGDQW